MRSIIKDTESGHLLEVVFADKRPMEDTEGFARGLLGVFAMLDRSFAIDGQITLHFGEAMKSGNWGGMNTFTLNILDDFDPEIFIERTLDCGMIESIRRLKR